MNDFIDDFWEAVGSKVWLALDDYNRQVINDAVLKMMRDKNDEIADLRRWKDAN